MNLPPLEPWGMYWDLGFLATVVALFLGAFYSLRWGVDNREIDREDSWKIVLPGSGGS